MRLLEVYVIHSISAKKMEVSAGQNSFPTTTLCMFFTKMESIDRKETINDYSANDKMH